MKVYGASVVKGLLYTLKTFVETYIEDFKRLGGQTKDHEQHGLRSFEEGVVTVQYPEAPMPIGSTYERFRVLPMLVYDKLTPDQKPAAPETTRVAKEHSDKDIRCTACGICAKVCPPQCIWIVQESDDKGKPITNPNQFYIDTSVCMNCGMCAEFCPFDAIKMDHQFALNVTEKRQESYLYDLEKLLVPAEYYAELHPKADAAEVATRKAEAEAKAAKDAAKKEAAAKKAAEAKAAAAAAPADAPATTAKTQDVASEPATPKAADPEREAKIAAAKAKAAEAKAKKEAAKAAEGGDAPVAAAQDSTPASEPAPAKAVDPEREAKIAAAKAKAAEAKAKKEAEKAATATLAEATVEGSSASEAPVKTQAIVSQEGPSQDAVTPESAPVSQTTDASLASEAQAAPVSDPADPPLVAEATASPTEPAATSTSEVSPETAEPSSESTPESSTKASENA